MDQHDRVSASSAEENSTGREQQECTEILKEGTTGAGAEEGASAPDGGATSPRETAPAIAENDTMTPGGNTTSPDKGTPAPSPEAAIVDLARVVGTEGDLPNERWLLRFIRAKNAGVTDTRRHLKKRALLPYFLAMEERFPGFWEERGIDETVRERLVTLLRAKPRRTASGVATITVITKPWPCAGTCRYCPNDLRMPKSYLADEPACQRAEQSFFDPYLQVSSRLNTLHSMGHPVDKVELIVLGGTWTDYPAPYRRWFIKRLFDALNDGPGPEARTERARIKADYRARGLARSAEENAALVDAEQHRVNAGDKTYNQAWAHLYGTDPARTALAAEQTASYEEVGAAQRANETAASRCVGLSLETRPDAISYGSLTAMRRLGCTKVQIGVQSLDGGRLLASDRAAGPDTVARAFALLRLHGFKIHAHMMANLPGADPASDKADYRRLVTDPRFRPDEVKLYPCALIGGTALERDWKAGRWRPYDRDELMDVLASAVAVTPSYMRISRMVRDFSAADIVAGNREANLRQAVEERLAAEGAPVTEIRMREIAGADADGAELSLGTTSYDGDVAEERFLSWTLPDGRIAGFCRLSLPREDEVAMIREVHVYGRVSHLGTRGPGAQHRGLGRALVEEACRQAADAGYTAIDVISAVGTRPYYRTLGFEDHGLYQRRAL